MSDNPRTDRQASRCACGQRGCVVWHVGPEASVQGVGFTETQARAVAALLNAMDAAPELEWVEVLSHLSHTLTVLATAPDPLPNRLGVFLANGDDAFERVLRAVSTVAKAEHHA